MQPVSYRLMIYFQPRLCPDAVGAPINRPIQNFNHLVVVVVVFTPRTNGLVLSVSPSPATLVVDTPTDTPAKYNLHSVAGIFTILKLSPLPIVFIRGAVVV